MRFHCPSLTSLVYFRRLCDTLLTPVRLVGCLPTPILPNRNFQTGSYPTGYAYCPEGAYESRSEDSVTWKLGIRVEIFPTIFPFERSG